MVSVYDSAGSTQVFRRIDVAKNTGVVDIDFETRQSGGLENLAQILTGVGREDRGANRRRKRDRMPTAPAVARNDDTLALAGGEDGGDRLGPYERHVAGQDDDRVTLGHRQTRLNGREHAARRIRIDGDADARIAEKRHGAGDAIDVRRREHHHEPLDAAVDERTKRAAEQGFAVDDGKQFLIAESLSLPSGRNDCNSRHGAGMFTFTWNTFSGSYFALICFSLGRLGP